MRLVLSALLSSACGEVGVTVFQPAEGPRPGGGVAVEGAPLQISPALALDGDDVILLWCEPATNGPVGRVLAARVRPGDEVVRGEAVLESRSIDVRVWPRRDEWLVSTQEGTRASLWSLTRDLDVFDRQSVSFASSSAELHAVRDGDTTFAVWTANLDNDYDVWGGVVGDDNIVRSDAGSLTPGRVYEYAPALARVGSSKLLVWLRFSARVNYNFDIAGRWLSGAEPSFFLEQEGNQSSLVATGGASVALLVWWDGFSGGLVATRVRPDGTMVDRAPVRLWPTATPRAAAAAVPGGFVIVGHGMRDGVPTLRLLHVDESSRIEPDRAVWLAGGQVADSGDRPAIVLDETGRGMVAFTLAVPTSTVVRARRIGLVPLGGACRAARECLTSRCVSGRCAEE